jgi:hypothetical protein
MQSSSTKCRQALTSVASMLTPTFFLTKNNTVSFFFTMNFLKALHRVHSGEITLRLTTAIAFLAISGMPTTVKAQVDFRTDQVANAISGNGGRWGSWTRPTYCPPGTWAGGYTMRVEPSLGSGDDTALNAVALYCRDRGGREIARISPHPGYWGTWGEGANCPQGSFLTHFSLKVEQPQGSGDDTAANSVRFSCSNGQLIEARGQKWGSYGQWSGGFANSAICGVRAKFEEKQGSGDDTALNDLEFFWCSVR